MKNKKQQKESKPVHLHLDHFFRKQYCIYAVLAVVFVGLCKADNRLLTAMNQVYTQNFYQVGEHMREETTRMPITINMAARIPTMSGR